MKKITAILLCLTLTATHLSAQNAQCVPNTVIVKYKSEKAAADRTAEFEYLCKTSVRKAGRMFRVRKTDSPSANLSRIYRIEYEGNATPAEMASKLSQSDGVEYAEPYWIPELLETPDDPSVGSQYFLSITRALDAFDLTHGDTNIVIGIVDTGVDIYHKDLTDNIKINYADPVNGIDDDFDGYIDNYRGWDLASNDNNPISSANHHGTIVAGIAAATTNNGLGIASVGYNTKFLPIKVSDDDKGTMTTCYEGIVYAADHGCKIINCSWGSPAKNLLCDDVIEYAQSRGCLIVAAAGNTGTNVRYYPASSNGVISVAATNQNDAKWSGSTYNICIDVSAPGQGNYSTSFGDKYQYSNGTSFASPVVAGAAALIWSVRKELTAKQIGELLRVTADNIDTIPENAPYAGYLGSGRINILKALTDRTLPSLRITNHQFSAGDAGFVSGADITVSINVRNYLSTARNVRIRLESPDGSAIIGSGAWQTDSIGPLRDAENLQFTATLSDTLSPNRMIPLRFRFEADGYKATQYVELIVNPTFKDIEWGEMQTTIADNGKIGIYDYDTQRGNGFIYQNCYNLVSDGALILALDKSTIASSFQTDNEFVSVSKPTVTTEDGVKHIRSTIKPKEINGISIEQDFIFDSRNLPTAFVCDYKIINTRNESFDNAAAGLYFDWDIVNSVKNQANYDAERRMLYIYNTGDIGLYGGICLFDNKNAVPYVFEIDNQNSNSIEIKDGFSNEQKWEAMNTPRSASTSVNTDLALMLTCNNLTLEPNDTVNLRFAILAAENMYGLRSAANKAIEIYGFGNQTIIPPDSNIVSIGNTTANRERKIYPTSCQTNIYVESDSDIDKISISNASGIAELTLTPNGCRTANIDVSQLGNGVHIVVVTNSDGEKWRQKIVKNRE